VVAAYGQALVVGAAIRAPMSRIAAVVAGAGSQPRFEERDHASQTATRLIRNGQARRTMLVELPARFFNRPARTTTGRQGSHDLFDAHFRSAPVISRHAATHVALGDDADQLKGFCILNHRLRSRSLNHASLARRVPPNLAAYSTKTLRSVSSHRYNNAFSFLPS
jgi:hypothetical protein